MRFWPWSILSFVCLLGSCQSNRLAPFRPAASAYHSTQLAQNPPLAPDSTGTPLPVFEADASSLPEVSLTKVAQPASALAGAKLLVRRQRGLSVGAGTVPDTLRGRPVGPGWPLAEPTRAPVPASAPDPSTSTVNMIGGGIVLATLVTLFIGVDPDHGSSLRALSLILVAITLFPIGVILLLYQGKNGRQRLKREARRRARTGAAPDANTSLPSPSDNISPPISPAEPRDSLLRKMGIGLILIGGLLLIAGAILGLYGLLFLGLPGLILLLVGLILSISAI